MSKPASLPRSTASDERVLSATRCLPSRAPVALGPTRAGGEGPTKRAAPFYGFHLLTSRFKLTSSPPLL